MSHPFSSRQVSSSQQSNRTAIGTGSDNRQDSPRSPGRHPMFRGIRSRSGKWVSEIREPRKSNRIWLGTYPTPEMAASAYDAAAYFLKGSNAVLNFPESYASLPVPASSSHADIQAAAAAAASLRRQTNSAASSTGPNRDRDRDRDRDLAQNDPIVTHGSPPSAPAPASAAEGEGPFLETENVGQIQEPEFLDEEELFDMPSLIVSMAEGMLVSPPRMDPPPENDNGDSDSGGLWSYP
ncbi:ethylene-responsive transcription factor ERF027 [Amborella trichopoda]|uniref:AP2/ERF domain-containing protein n=1 Tax=Amborella trichopoda TaxID=13333 RepID=U5DD81_AMBTC|nr:ethylene-responsive transcription factor ERF027 [Amborella trichopoda]ERN19382.1 hypothetical protein AMTR_s00069p00140780 [Amborella trichopoda]|eukprot:XP_020531457.1 ethylene-responsive transcription factor ERF027 [Amborella trichopoda]